MGKTQTKSLHFTQCLRPPAGGVSSRTFPQLLKLRSYSLRPPAGGISSRTLGVWNMLIMLLSKADFANLRSWEQKFSGKWGGLQRVFKIVMFHPENHYSPEWTFSSTFFWRNETVVIFWRMRIWGNPGEPVCAIFDALQLLGASLFYLL